MRDPSAALIHDPSLLAHILEATFDASQRGLITECLGINTSTSTSTNATSTSTSDPDTNSNSLLSHLTPHERAVLLAQALTGTILFLHRLADSQQSTSATPAGLTPGAITRQLAETRGHSTERRAVLETVEGSGVFTSCTLRGQVAEVMVRAVQRAERAREGQGGARRHAGAPRGIVVEDDSELQEISLSFVNDKGPDDMVLPSGLTILPLT